MTAHSAKAGQTIIPRVWINSIGVYAPGLVIILLISVSGMWLSKFTRPWISDVAVVILIGLLIRNTIGGVKVYQPGARFSVQRLLRLGIILLGIKLSFIDILRSGILSLLIVLIFSL